MGTQLTWKTKLFKNKYDIFQNEKHIGELRSSLWSKTCRGELNGKKHIFKTKGFFTPETQILNPENNSIEGQIFFSTWKAKTRIVIGGKEYIWAFDNFFHTKWSICCDGKTIIDYKTYNFSGDINTVSLNDDLVILSGLFIKNFFDKNDSSDSSASM